MSWAARLCVALLGVLLVSCYLPSAARRSAGIARNGWDVEERGPWVVLTGPGAILLATTDLVINSVIPINYDGYFLIDRREPQEKWFRFYTGEMQPLNRVAVLCNVERATTVRTIRQLNSPSVHPARFERWHFPHCIEVLPGSYELEVHYFLRKTETSVEATSTEHKESTEPSLIVWHADAGGVYALKAIMGQTQTAAGAAPRSRVSRRSSLGTSSFELREGSWAAQIDRLPSWRYLDEPVRGYRERWAYYERVKR